MKGLHAEDSIAELYRREGINNSNMFEYLKDLQVPAVGSSWVVVKELVAKEDWSDITSRAREVRAAVEA